MWVNIVYWDHNNPCHWVNLKYYKELVLIPASSPHKKHYELYLIECNEDMVSTVPIQITYDCAKTIDAQLQKQTIRE